jgi:hypothetical protein
VVTETAPRIPAPARRPVRTAAITNLGCKVNQSEMEAAARPGRRRVIPEQHVELGQERVLRAGVDEPGRGIDGRERGAIHLD